MDHLPRRLRSDLDRVDKAQARLSQALHREPTIEELAEALKQPLEEVMELLQPAVQVVEEMATHEGPGVDELLERGERQAALAGAIRALPERLQILLALYYDEGLTYREIARILQVSEPRVCQLHAEAVKKLRAELGEAGT